MDSERLDLPSASSFNILVNCAGQPNLLRTIPEAEREIVVEEIAERGIRIHHARETSNPMVLQDESEDAAYRRGLHNEGIILSEWRDQFGITAVREELEQRLWMFKPGTFEPVTSGQLDVLYVEDGVERPHIALIDWKSFYAIAAGNAADSWQLRVYAVLAALEYNAVHVRAAFNKPEARNQIDVIDFDKQALEYYEYLIRWHLWFATLPDAPRRAGSWCNWCAAKGHCPEVAATAMLPLVHSAGGILERVDTLPPAALKTLWDQATIIGKVLSRVDERLGAMSDDALAEIGLYKGKGKKSEKVIDVIGAIGKLRESGLTDADILNCLKMPKGPLIELIRREFALSSDEKAGAWLTDKIGQYVQTDIGKPIIREKR